MIDAKFLPSQYKVYLYDIPDMTAEEAYHQRQQYFGTMALIAISDKVAYATQLKAENFCRISYMVIINKLKEIGFETLLMERHGKLIAVDVETRRVSRVV